jgi:AAA domain
MWFVNGLGKMCHMNTIARNIITESEKSLKALYQSLMKGTNHMPDLSIYAACRDAPTSSVAPEMFREWMREGELGLEAYMVELSESEDPAYKRLLKILLDEPLEEEGDAGILLSDVKPQKMPWLWHPRLALGKITMLDGDPGLGKSLLGADLGARITNGDMMPDGTPCQATGGVVVIMPEDTLEDTILPRFARAGADLSKVVDLSTVKTDEGEESRRPFRLQTDLVSLEAAIYRVDAKLVYIDPIMALLGGDMSMNRDEDVRMLLLPLKGLIERLQVACVMVRHMTKTRGENPLLAGQGSIAFIGLARAGLMVAKHPQEKSQVIFSHIKSNIGPLAPPIAYTICSDEAEGDERPYVVWYPETELRTLDEISAPRKRSRK